MAKKKAKDKTVKNTSFFHWDKDVLVLNVLGSPGEREDAIGKVKGTQLKISVTETPRSGRATEHMIKFLAKVFGVKKTDIEVVFGWKNVNKQLRIKSPKNLPEIFSESTQAELPV